MRAVTVTRPRGLLTADTPPVGHATRSSIAATSHSATASPTFPRPQVFKCALVLVSVPALWALMLLWVRRVRGAQPVALSAPDGDVELEAATGTNSVRPGSVAMGTPAGNDAAVEDADIKPW